MAIRYDAIAKNGTYTKDGVEKNKWVSLLDTAFDCAFSSMGI